MDCPTPCVCGEIVELHDMCSINSTTPMGGNLVCEECLCDMCGGDGTCGHCSGGSCYSCGGECPQCEGQDTCSECGGNGYVVQDSD